MEEEKNIIYVKEELTINDGVNFGIGLILSHIIFIFTIIFFIGIIWFINSYIVKIV